MKVIVADAESIEDNNRGYKKQKKRSAKNIDVYDNDDDVDNDDMIKAKLKRNRKKEQRRKVS